MSVTSGWGSLKAVLEEVAPATAASFRPGASPEDIDAAEAATGCRWPGELREWFSVQNGQVDGPESFGGELLSMQQFFSLDQLVAERIELVALSEQMASANPDVYEGGFAAIASRESVAGSVTELFLPTYVPISGQDSLDNFCDTREGNLNGCVSFWAYDAGGAGPPLWSSISEMLAAIKHCITDQPPAGWVMVVEDGVMHWEPDPEGTNKRLPQLIFDPGFDDDPNYVVTPIWPEIPFNLPDTASKVIRSHHVPREQSVDLIAAQYAVIDDATRRYRPGRITSIGLHGFYGGFSLPRVPGQQLRVRVAVGGHDKWYTITATDTDGGFRINPLPPE
jgi:cell wall assembly regulator SMI1